MDTALARPQSSNSWQTYTSEGIDIALALDVSTSMLARDFTPDRLEAAKEVATKFILERPQDKIGLVVFAGESFTPVSYTHLYVYKRQVLKCSVSETDLLNFFVLFPLRNEC